MNDRRLFVADDGSRSGKGMTKCMRALTGQEIVSKLRNYDVKLLSRWSPTRSYMISFDVTTDKTGKMTEKVFVDGQIHGQSTGTFSVRGNELFLHYGCVVPSPHTQSSHNLGNPLFTNLHNVRVGHLYAVSQPDQRDGPVFIAVAQYPDEAQDGKPASLYTFYRK